MTDLARQALTNLPKLAKGITGVAKQTFTLDMQVLDDAIDDKQIMNSIQNYFTKLEPDLWKEIEDNINKNLDCDHLKEIIIKNFKEFIDQKIFHSHFHSRNRKTNDTNSLSVFYRHGISKIITKMMDDEKNSNQEIKDFFNDEIIKVMEKLEYETFKNIIQNEFETPIQVETKPSTDKKEDPIQTNFINSIIDEKAENDFLKNPLITQDMKEELFYHLFKDDIKDILAYFDKNNLPEGFHKIEELQDFCDRIEFKQQDKIEQKQKEELQTARQKGIFSMFTKTEAPMPKKNKITYVSEDSNLI